MRSSNLGEEHARDLFHLLVAHAALYLTASLPLLRLLRVFVVHEAPHAGAGGAVGQMIARQGCTNGFVRVTNDAGGVAGVRVVLQILLRWAFNDSASSSSSSSSSSGTIGIGVLVVVDGDVVDICSTNVPVSESIGKVRSELSKRCLNLSLDSLLVRTIDAASIDKDSPVENDVLMVLRRVCSRIRRMKNRVVISVRDAVGAHHLIMISIHGTVGALHAIMVPRDVRIGCINLIVVSRDGTVRSVDGVVVPSNIAVGPMDNVVVSANVEVGLVEGLVVGQGRHAAAVLTSERGGKGSKLKVSIAHVQSVSPLDCVVEPADRCVLACGEYYAVHRVLAKRELAGVL